MANPYWPLFELVIRTPRLEIRYPDDDDLIEIAELAAKGIHDENYMPFAFPWSREPSPKLERNSIQHYWLMRAQWTAEEWHLNPVTVVDGVIVGMQGMGATEFALRKTVATGSWLGQAHQGKGLGKEQRAAMLHFAFEGLGALRAESEARDDNGPSVGVSRSLGYRDNGDTIRVREGIATRDIRFVMTREMWLANRRDDIVIEGLEPCLELFGATP